jgi:hypothetical protein
MADGRRRDRQFLAGGAEASMGGDGSEYRKLRELCSVH